MYLDYKKIREFEDKIGFEVLINKNIEIGKFLNFEPEIEWMVGTEGNQVVKREYYPHFHSDWNHLMEAIKRLKEKGSQVGIAPDDIFYTWQLVSQNCN